jgi:hypothetical protein
MSWNDNDDMDFNFDDLSPEENERIEREEREKDKKMRQHPLYLKANEIYRIVHTMADTLEQEEREMHMSTLLESAIMLAPKFAGAMGSGSWTLSMQNAALMRYHAQYLHTSTSLLHEMSGIPKEYVRVLRSEMKEFRTLFKEWIKTFEDLEDEGIDDEWGLFSRN